MALLNVVRVILLIASIASFVPQYRRILSRGDYVGISHSYLLFNQIVATEQLAFGLHLFINSGRIMDGIINNPPSFGDWLNLAQFIVVWICHVFLQVFGLYLSHPPLRYKTKAIVVILYLAFLLISLLPVLFEATLPPEGSDPNHDRRWVSAIWEYAHIYDISPIVTGIAFVALFPQLRELRSRTADPGALSVEGLAVQAAVFFVVALSWALRLRMPNMGWVIWYQIVGWATVDNAVFAFVEAVLWIFARRRGFAGTNDSETTPLIGA